MRKRQEYVCIYLPGCYCYLRGGKSTPRERRLPRREGSVSPLLASSASAPLLHPCGIRGCTALPNMKHVCTRKVLCLAARYLLPDECERNIFNSGTGPAISLRVHRYADAKSGKPTELKKVAKGATTRRPGTQLKIALSTTHLPFAKLEKRI